ncbi:DNA-binding family protein [Raphanus sativus]|nr:DNA-binding family protein [Raphanus sativus]
MIDAAAPPRDETLMKGKRRQFRKYGHNGPVSLALLSSSFSTTLTNEAVVNLQALARNRDCPSTVKQTLSETCDLEKNNNQDSLMCELMMPSSSGMSFTPHMIVVSIVEKGGIVILTTK